MKKMLNLILVLFFLFLSIDSSKAMTFDEAYSNVNRTPMVVLIYADWADGAQNCIQQYRAVQSQFANQFNFSELNIAKPEAKSFTEKYHIYPKLPYILMFRDGGKVSRYISRDCANSASCISSKLRSFIQ